ncbi:MAG: shikimate kinase [Bacteroidales bacterium]|nr:shikimate kinase [Bacteroidales bacterium]
MIISLTGFMGCGKSSVGRKLSQLLCCPFMDLDPVIEERTGRSIPDIFANDGEAAFRQMELDTLQNILREVGRQSAPPAPSHSRAAGPSPIVLSLGGGTVMTPECAELVREKTLCIYLRTSVNALVCRLASEAEGRPLLDQASHPGDDGNNSPNESAALLRSRIESMMSRRASTYEATAHMTIDTDDLSIDEIAQTLATKVKIR